MTGFYTFSIIMNLAVSIVPPKCQQQWFGWSYCATSPKLGKNEVKTKGKP